MAAVLQAGVVGPTRTEVDIAGTKQMSNSLQGAAAGFSTLGQFLEKSKQDWANRAQQLLRESKPSDMEMGVWLRSPQAKDAALSYAGDLFRGTPEEKAAQAERYLQGMADADQSAVTEMKYVQQNLLNRNIVIGPDGQPVPKAQDQQQTIAPPATAVTPPKPPATAVTPPPPPLLPKSEYAVKPVIGGSGFTNRAEAEREMGQWNPASWETEIARAKQGVGGKDVVAVQRTASPAAEWLRKAQEHYVPSSGPITNVTEEKALAAIMADPVLRRAYETTKTISPVDAREDYRKAQERLAMLTKSKVREERAEIPQAQQDVARLGELVKDYANPAKVPPMFLPSAMLDEAYAARSKPVPATSVTPVAKPQQVSAGSGVTEYNGRLGSPSLNPDYYKPGGNATVAPYLDIGVPGRGPQNQPPTATTPVAATPAPAPTPPPPAQTPVAPQTPQERRAYNADTERIIADGRKVMLSARGQRDLSPLDRERLLNVAQSSSMNSDLWNNPTVGPLLQSAALGQELTKAEIRKAAAGAGYDEAKAKLVGYEAQTARINALTSELAAKTPAFANRIKYLDDALKPFQEVLVDGAKKDKNPTQYYMEQHKQLMANSPIYAKAYNDRALEVSRAIGVPIEVVKETVGFGPWEKDASSWRPDMGSSQLMTPLAGAGVGTADDRAQYERFFQ